MQIRRSRFREGTSPFERTSVSAVLISAEPGEQIKPAHGSPLMWQQRRGERTHGHRFDRLDNRSVGSEFSCAIDGQTPTISLNALRRIRSRRTERAYGDPPDAADTNLGSDIRIGQFLLQPCPDRLAREMRFSQAISNQPGQQSFAHVVADGAIELLVRSCRVDDVQAATKLDDANFVETGFPMRIDGQASDPDHWIWPIGGRRTRDRRFRK